MEKIDFVIAWVDGNDPEWLKEKNKFSDTKIDVNNNINRYRDMNVLKYWFRGVEKFTPWVNRIHFVTWGHVPLWLDTNNPKINIVKHSDFIPKKYLPTFSANPIELNFHRIKGLADKFVYFNDDIFVIKPTPSTYFFKKGLPCDTWREDIYCLDKKTDPTFAHILLNDRLLISRNFCKRDVFKKNFRKCLNPIYGRKNLGFLLLAKWPYMAEFSEYHTASAFLKKTYEEVWAKEGEFLDETCRHKFRTMNDVNQNLLQYWQICSGNFTPRSYKNFGKYFELKNDNKELLNCIDQGLNNIICINDTDPTIDYDKTTSELAEHFEKILPEKSSFEK